MLRYHVIVEQSIKILFLTKNITPHFSVYRIVGQNPRIKRETIETDIESCGKNWLKFNIQPVN